MNQKNRETMERAIGIVEGLSWVADAKTSEALISVVEMLDAVLEAENAP